MDLVNNFLTNELKIKQNDCIVVGVSAGPDSMFLLYLLIMLRKKINFKIIVSHINHKVRVESDEEESFLKKYCLDNNVIFESMKIEHYSKENFHAYARNIRYDFYKKLIDKYKANYLMTAHHGDDLIETILMRITRGSTLVGYQGIQLIRNMDTYKIVRPLLYLTKEQIKKYDDDLNIPYRIDKSNLSAKYTRNRFRMNILPFLKDENENVHLKFLKFSQKLEENNNYIENIVNKVYNKVYVDKKINIILFNKEELFIKKLLLERILNEIYIDLSNIEEKHILILINLILNNKTGSSVNLPDNIIACVDYGYLVFKKIKNTGEYCYELTNGIIVPNGMKFISYSKEENGNDIIHLNSSDVKLPLYVRNKRDGDYIELKGTNGSKKVSDIFIDNKISKEDRKCYPVVVDDNNKVIWIPKLKKSKYDSSNHEKCDIIFKCL